MLLAMADGQAQAAPAGVQAQAWNERDAAIEAKAHSALLSLRGLSASDAAAPRRKREMFSIQEAVGRYLDHCRAVTASSVAFQATGSEALGLCWLLLFGRSFHCLAVPLSASLPPSKRRLISAQAAGLSQRFRHIDVMFAG
jgi:hypothetical protein